jgi:Pyruvate/2-oxoacid:ferredoxin oxidoreductase delta subunit
MAIRKVVQIDEEKCDGCGVCVPACEEGAIQIRDGKARLVSDVYCDGLGACLGECPQDAIAIIQREAEAFDEEAVEQHLAATQSPAAKSPAAHPGAACGCPGAAVRDLGLNVLPSGGPALATSGQRGTSDGQPSALGHWPIQLTLVPPGAPFLENADVLLAAHCVPFAMADFHQRFLQGRPVLIACPKLDDAQAHVHKLAAILAASSIRSLTIVHMEVPCCTGLVRIAEAAKELVDSRIPVNDVVISIRGQVKGSGV